MKYTFHIFLIILICLAFYACAKSNELMKKDNESESLIEGSDCKSEEVIFTITYPYINSITPSTFELIKTPITIKDAGTTKSLYTSTSIIVKTKDEYTRIKSIPNTDTIEFVTDFCNLVTSKFICIDSSYTNNIESIVVPAKYDTFIYEKLDEYREGGDTIYREEIKIDYPHLVSDATSEMYENYSFETCINFVIPRNVDVINIVDSIYNSIGNYRCLKSTKYRIKE